MAITKLNASVDLLNDVDTTTAAPANKEVLAWDSSTSQWEPLENNFVEEAPTSGLVYGRANGTWVEVTGGGGSGGTGGAGSVNLAYDKLTPNGTADTFDLTIAGEARGPLGATNLLVSVNGVIQEPGVAFTTAGSTITFTEVPQTDDVIDFIVELTNGSHWELNGVNLEYAGEGTKVIVDQFQANGNAVFMGNIGVNTVPSPDYDLQVEGKSLFNSGSSRVAIDPSESTSGYEAKFHPTDEAFETSINSSSRGFAWNNGTGRLMTISQAGNFGVGTDEPVVKLHVKGPEARIDNLGQSTNGYIRFLNDSGSMSVGMSGAAQNILLTYDRTNSDNASAYVGGPEGSWKFYTDGQERLIINKDGYVGIDSQPGYKIAVGGKTGFVIDTEEALGTQGDQTTTIGVTSGGQSLRLRSSGTGAIKFNVGSDEKMVLSSQGNLSLSGTISAPYAYLKSSTLAYGNNVNTALVAEAPLTSNYKNTLRHENTGLTFSSNSNLTGVDF